jgi:hypothetical protein
MRGIPLELLDENNCLDGDPIQWVEDAPDLDLGACASFAAEQRALGHSLVFLRLKDFIVGAAAFSVQALPEARVALDTLRAEDAPFLLATKAPRLAAEKTAEDLEISHVHANCSEVEFSQIIKKLLEDKMLPVWARTGELAEWQAPGLCAAELDDMRPAALHLQRLDILALVRAWILARRYKVAGQWAAILALVAQLALLFSGLSPLQVAFGATVSGFLCALICVRLRITSLDHLAKPLACGKKAGEAEASCYPEI